MKIPVIRKLVELHTLEELQAAEAAIAEGLEHRIEVEGEDEGEKLTHAFAAMEIKGQVDQGVEFKEALRNFTQRVRNCIS